MDSEMAIKQKKLREKLNRRPNHPQERDIFLLAHPETMGLEWVILRKDENDPELFLTVPADDNPMVGSADVDLPDGALCSPLTLRCQHSLFLKKDDFDLKRRVGILENWHWYRALDQMKQLSEGDLISTISQQETDDEFEYEEWMKQVQSEREILRKAMDGMAQLIDFEWIGTSEEDVVAPEFTFAWRFDRQRQVQLKVYLQDGSARLIQTYGGKKKLPDNMLQPLQFYDHYFEIPTKYVKAKVWRCQLSSEWVSKIAKAFNLPEPYQDWDFSIRTIQRLLKLVVELNKSLKGLYTYTNHEIWKLYSLLSDAWRGFLQQACRPQAVAYFGSRFVSRTIKAGKSTFINALLAEESGSELLNPLVMQTEKVEANQRRLTLVWPTPPEMSQKDIKVTVEVNGKPQSEVQSAWEAEDFSYLRLSHLSVSEKAEVGALWEKETGELRLSFKSK